MSNTSAASGARVTYVTMTAFSSDKGRKFVRVRAEIQPHISPRRSGHGGKIFHRQRGLAQF